MTTMYIFFPESHLLIEKEFIKFKFLLHTLYILIVIFICKQIL